MTATFLLRLLALPLGAVFFLAADAQARVSEKFSQTYAFAADGVISLSNINGDVDIEAWDRNEVLLEAEKFARDEESLARIRLAIEHRPERLAIKTEIDRKLRNFWNHGRAEVRYKLKVPAGVSLRQVDVVNSEIRVTGVTGYVDLDSVNGSIEAEGLASGGRFDTVNGSIKVGFTKVGATDRIVLDTVNGSCTAELPADAAFSLVADSVNGRVSCDFPIEISKSGRTVLKGKVNGGGATVVLDSVNGALRVRTAK